jgi:hypothetical protein
MMKQGGLFCFVLFRHDDISQTMVLHVVLLVSLESSRWVGSDAPTWFETIWSCYGVEAIEYWTIFLMKTKSNQKSETVYWNWEVFLVNCWKALGESNLIEFISQFSELRCGRCWFLSGFCCWKFKQIAKILDLGRKNRLKPSSMCSHC